MNNSLYQFIGHIPFILLGIWSILIGIFSNINIEYRLGFCVCGIGITLIMIKSWYVGLTDPEYNGDY